MIGIVSAIEALRDGHTVTIVEPGEPGGEQAASYGNAAGCPRHSVIPPSEPGLWRKVPGYILDPFGPLAIRWRYLPPIAPWLLRYLLSGATAARVETIARALRPLLVGAPALHRTLAAEAGVPHLIEQAGVMHVFPSRDDFQAARLGWDIRRKVGIDWLELSEDECASASPTCAALHVRSVRRGGWPLPRPGAYVAALADHARALGAAIVKDRAVGLQIEGGRLKGVSTATHGMIACDRAVICAGARSKALARMAGDRVSLETERGYHVVIRDPPLTLRSTVMAADAKFVVNAMEQGLRAAGQVELAGLEAAPNWRRAAILRESLFQMLPGLPRDLPADRFTTWFGHRPQHTRRYACHRPVAGNARRRPCLRSRTHRAGIQRAHGPVS